MKTVFRLTPKVVEGVISSTAGSDCIPVYKYLKGKKNISEFVLAEKLETEINIIRNMLYRLYNSNLVGFIRKKDKQKGWYIYYWTFNAKQVKFLLRSLKQRRIEMLSERLVRETGSQFYGCVDGHLRLNFEKAIEYNYKCPECGRLLELSDNTEKIREITAELVVLKKELATLT